MSSSIETKIQPDHRLLVSGLASIFICFPCFIIIIARSLHALTAFSRFQRFAFQEAISLQEQLYR